jgi:hypothetical protein
MQSTIATREPVSVTKSRTSRATSAPAATAIVARAWRSNGTAGSGSGART